MMNKAYISATPKTWIKEWFKDGSWSHDDTTSVLIRRDNGKMIQVFGCGKAGDYDYLKNENGYVKLINSQTTKFLGYGTIVGYANDLVKGATTYVFK